jgi:hypothetical protein
MTVTFGGRFARIGAPKAVIAACIIANPALAQVDDAYRITSGKFSNRSDYGMVTLKPGRLGTSPAREKQPISVVFACCSLLS